jgi:hypothetical protein
MKRNNVVRAIILSENLFTKTYFHANFGAD